MTYTYFVNGVDLNDSAGRWFLEKSSTRRTLPAVRSTAATLPLLHGETFPTRDRLEPTSMGISIAVTDNDDNGTPAGAEQTELNLELISGMFSMPRLEIEHRVGNQSRFNIGRRESSVSPNTEAAALVTYVATFIIRFPNPFWVDTLTGGEISTAALPGTTSSVPVEMLGGGNAPVLNPTLRFKGPLTFVSATDPLTGTAISWDGVLPSDRFLYIAPGQLRAWTASSPSAWGDISSSASGGLDYPPTGTLEIWPTGTPSTYQLQVRRNAALNQADAFAIRSERSFL